MSDSIILKSATKWLLPLLLVFALVLLLRGHHEPGGGFVAGLTAAGAFAVYGMAHHGARFSQILRVTPTTIVAAGLGVALSGAVAGWLAGETFFQARWTQLGETLAAVKVGTPLVFDLGVAMVVLGFALLAFEALEERHD